MPVYQTAPYTNNDFCFPDALQTISLAVNNISTLEGGGQNEHDRLQNHSCSHRCISPFFQSWALFLRFCSHRAKRIVRCASVKKGFFNPRPPYSTNVAKSGYHLIRGICGHRSNRHLTVLVSFLSKYRTCGVKEFVVFWSTLAVYQ